MSHLTTYAELTQGSDEWLEARRGLVTASVVGKLLTPTLKVAANDTSRALTLTLFAERITGQIEDVFVSADMERGTDDEPFARDLYAEHHAPVTQVGFMRRDFAGYSVGWSPDGLVSTDGAIEIKSRKPVKQINTILNDEVPTENMAQLQAALLVSGRDWIDYVSYAEGLPLYVKRVEPQQDWFDAITCAAEDLEANIVDLTARYNAAIDGLPVAERIPEFTNEVELFLS